MKPLWNTNSSVQEQNTFEFELFLLTSDKKRFLNNNDKYVHIYGEVFPKTILEHIKRKIRNSRGGGGGRD